MSKEIIEAIEGLGKSFEQRLEESAKTAAERADALDKKIEEVRSQHAQAAERIEQTERAVAEQSIDIGLSDKDIKKYSISRAIAGFIKHEDPEKHCPFEYDVHRQIMKAHERKVEERFGGSGEAELQRTMTTLSDSTGGFLIPEEVSNVFYNNFRASTVLGQIGVTEIRPRGIPYRINKKTSNTTAYRRGEGSAVSASDIAFGQVTLSPKSISARTVISAENVMWPEPSTDALVERDLMETLALKMDYDFFMGSGASNTPIGIVNTTGVSNLASNSGTGAAPTYEKVGVDLPFALRLVNVPDDGSFAYVGHPGHLKLLRKEQTGGSTTSDGPYILAPWAVPLNGEFLPYKWVDTTALEGLGADSGATPMFFGRWSDAVHAMWGGLMVKRSDVATDGTYNALTQGWNHIVITGWDDVGVIRPAAIKYDNDLDHA